MVSSNSKRVQRVERELFETLSHFLVHGLSESLPVLTSITAVEVNPNLRHARVFFRLVGSPDETRAAEELLTQKRHLFQREVAQTLKTKFCPVLKFEFGVAAQASDIDILLAGLQRRSTSFGD